MSGTVTSLADWLARIETFSPKEIELGLERVADVLDRLALTLPDQVLHVAGTNGKGSSVALAEALLGHSGRSVGCYTSPHIVHYNERIRVNGSPVSDDDIVTAFERVESAREETPLTYFEFGTLAAMVVFARNDVDIAVLEIGMGGRLDAVNAVEPTAGLITNIALDHCDWLGNDVEAIAHEKAGIMRSGKPIVFASTVVPMAISRRAEEVDADLVLAGRDYTWSVGANWQWQGRTHSLSGLQAPSLAGTVQIENAAGVLALLEACGFDELLDAETVNAAFTSVSLDGRMQRIDSDEVWYLDVAHNPAAASVLAATLGGLPAGGPTIAIVGMLDDKDVEGIVEPLVTVVDHWVAVAAVSARAIGVQELARRVASIANKACLEAETLDQAMEHARSRSGRRGRILVTGSFYLVGPVLEALGIYSPR